MKKPLPLYRPHVLVILLALTFVSLLTAFAVREKEYGTVMAEGDPITITSRWGMMGHVKMAMSQFGENVMVWQDSGGKSYEIYAQIFDDTGYPKSSTFRVNKFQPLDQKHPAIAMDELGNFVIVYQSYKQDGSEAGIFGQRYSYDGKLVNKVFLINTFIIDNQWDPAVAMNADGKFVVAWVSENQDKTPRSVYAQRFDESGKKVGGEFRVNTANAGSQDSPAVAIDSAGNFMIVWQSKSKDDSNVYGQVFDWNGKPKSQSDILLSAETDLNQSKPAVALTGNQLFMAVWITETYDNPLKTNLDSIKGQLFKTTGQKSGNEFSVSDPFFGHQDNPMIIKTSPSKLLVAWQQYSRKNGHKHWRIFGQKIYNSATKDGDVIELSAETDTYWQTDPALSSDGKGDTGAAWLNHETETGTIGIEYKRGL